MKRKSNNMLLKQAAEEKSSLELIGFKYNKYLYEVCCDLKVYDLSMPVDDEQVKALLDKTIKVTLEETNSNVQKTRGEALIVIHKDGKGQCFTIKNIQCLIVPFIETCFNIVYASTPPIRFLYATIFLNNLCKQLRVGLDEEEVAVSIALYSMTKQYVVTDENLFTLISKKLDEMEYGGLKEKQLYNIVTRLTDLEIITIENGKYTVSQYVYFR